MKSNETTANLNDNALPSNVDHDISGSRSYKPKGESLCVSNVDHDILGSRSGIIMLADILRLHYTR